MAINKKLIHFKTRAAFEIQLAEHNILDTSIVFIQDANLIWTHGTYYCLPSDDVVISNGIEPDNDQDLWIDTSDNTTAVSVEEAPTDGNMYVRKDGTWVVTLNEVYVGETEPTNGEVIWINPNTDEMQYFNGIQWVTVSGGVEAVETLVITLTSNQASPTDSGLIGSVVDVMYNGESHRSGWVGESLTFTIPAGVEYTITYSNIVDDDGNKIYKTPESELYTASAGKITTLTRVYEQSKIVVTRASNQDTSQEKDSLGASTALVSCSSWSNTKTITFSDLNPEVTLKVLPGDTVDIVYDEISNYATPASENIITSSEINTIAKTALYSTTIVTASIKSNQGEEDSDISSASMIISFTGGSQTLLSGESLKVPTGDTISVVCNPLDKYQTPTYDSFVATGLSKTVEVTYNTEIVTVSLSIDSNLSLTDTKFVINGTQFSWAGLGQSIKIAYGTQYVVSSAEIEDCSCTTIIQPLDETQISISGVSVTRTAGKKSCSILFSYKQTGCNFTIVDSNSSTSISTTGNGIAWLAGKRCLAKKTSDGVAICYLDASNSNLFHDGTTSASLDGSMGQWMTDLPEYYFYVDESTSGQHKVSLDATEKSGWQKSRRVLLGVTKGIVTNSKLWSKSGSAPTVSQTIGTFHTQANACGSGFDIIDYETHCKLAHMFYAKYGNRDPQNMSQFGTGSSTTGRTSGTTASLGNTDGKSSTQVNIFGVEDPYGNVYEWMGGITGNGLTYYIYDGLTTDATPANSRTISVPSNTNGWITKVKWGTYGDMIPTEFGGSETTYYADYGYVGYSGWRVVFRSNDYSYSIGGFAFFYGNNSSSNSDSSVGSRLQYRGNITIIEDPAEFIALPVGF